MYYWFLKKSYLHETILMVSKRPTDKLCFSNSNLNSIFNSDTVFALSEIRGLDSGMSPKSFLGLHLAAYPNDFSTYIIQYSEKAGFILFFVVTSKS